MVETKDNKWADLAYHAGFGNHFESEAIKGALPQGCNNPQKCPFGLYAEQISGTPFTFSKAKNQRSWLYRILPSAKHGEWKRSDLEGKDWISNYDSDIDMYASPE
jgi:homogentisate 1,2-dioxygenase